MRIASIKLVGAIFVPKIKEVNQMTREIDVLQFLDSTNPFVMELVEPGTLCISRLIQKETVAAEIKTLCDSLQITTDTVTRTEVTDCTVKICTKTGDYLFLKIGKMSLNPVALPIRREILVAIQ